MDTAYVVIIALAAAAYGYAALLNFVGAESVTLVADRVRVPRRWMVPLGLLLAAGAAGLLIGFAVPVLGIAAAGGLVIYFLCAVGAHVRAHDRAVAGAIAFLVLALLTLTVEIARRTHGI